MDYLSASGNVVTIDAQRRDWSDTDRIAHIKYHDAFFSNVPAPFSVVVDASRVPFRALAHVPLFFALCELARTKYKSQLEVCTIVRASYATRALYKLLESVGAIGTHTAAKIKFVDN